MTKKDPQTEYKCRQPAENQEPILKF